MQGGNPSPSPAFSGKKPAAEGKQPAFQCPKNLPAAYRLKDRGGIP
jgi:hypothetical protein